MIFAGVCVRVFPCVCVRVRVRRACVLRRSPAAIKETDKRSARHTLVAGHLHALGHQQIERVAHVLEMLLSFGGVLRCQGIAGECLCSTKRGLDDECVCVCVCVNATIRKTNRFKLV